MLNFVGTPDLYLHNLMQLLISRIIEINQDKTVGVLELSCVYHAVAQFVKVSVGCAPVEDSFHAEFYGHGDGGSRQGLLRGSILIALNQHQLLLAWLHSHHKLVFFVKWLHFVDMLRLKLQKLVELMKLLRVCIEVGNVPKSGPQHQFVYLIRRLHLVLLSFVVVFLVH